MYVQVNRKGPEIPCAYPPRPSESARYLLRAYLKHWPNNYYYLKPVN